MTLHRNPPIDNEKIFITGDVARAFLADHVEKRSVGDFLVVEHKNRKISPQTKNSLHISPRQLQDHPILGPIASTREPKHRIPSTLIPILLLTSFLLIYCLIISHTITQWRIQLNQASPFP